MVGKHVVIVGMYYNCTKSGLSQNSFVCYSVAPLLRNLQYALRMLNSKIS